MVSTNTDLRAQGREGERSIAICLNESASPLNKLAQRTRRFRPAPLARTVARFFSQLRPIEEDYLLSAGSPRRAGRPAIDARRAHAIIEEAVEVGVSGLNGSPPLFIANIPGLSDNCLLFDHFIHLEAILKLIKN